MSAPLWLGLCLGATSAAYAYLHPASFGFGFPNINGELAVRPTFLRVAGFVAGRWLGYVLLGLVLGWLGQICGDLALRLGLAAAALFSLFIFLFLATSSSPELAWAQRADLTRYSTPVLITGFFSVFLLHAPNLIAGVLSFLYPGFQSSLLFFTHVFLGSTLFLFPLYLNMRWARGKFFMQGMRVFMFASSMLIFIFSLNQLLKT